MTRSAIISMWLLVAAVSTLVLSWTGRRAYLASALADEQIDMAVSAASAQRELTDLTKSWSTHIGLQRPDTGLSPQISQSLAQTGLPASVLTSFQPGGETVQSRNTKFQIVQLQVTFTLEGLTLPQLGRFFQSWRTAQPTWVVNSVNLAPAYHAVRSTPANVSSTSVSANNTGFDAPIRAVVVIKNQFTESVPVASPQPGPTSAIRSSATASTQKIADPAKVVSSPLDSSSSRNIPPKRTNTRPTP